MSYRFSVVIPTVNNKSEKCFSLSHVIRAVLAQRDADFEIIIVDDNGSDGTTEAVTQLFPVVRVVHSNHPRHNLGYVRNLGSSHASGDILVFIDDDMVLSDQHVLRKVSGIMRDNDFCCGAYRYWTSIYWHKYIHLAEPATSTLRTLKSISVLPCGVNKLNGFRDLNEFTFIGNFGAIQRNTFDSVHGFNEGFQGWGFEDTELLMRLCMSNTRYALLHEHEISAFHLTHASDVQADFVENMRRFNDLELERGFYFHVNHFFGVYEADGFSLLTPIDQ
jgi:glycosyltransferase involved in cell wall biosynthesis